MESPPLGTLIARPHSRLFVIDDEPSIRAAIRRFLSRRGWEVEEAEDGRVALDILLHCDANRYDVVMCDLRMPFVSGAELHHELMQKRPDLVQRLVFSTGDVASAEAARFLAESERPVMEKPFELSLLEEMLNRVRDQSHAIDAP
jgi:DNA-binding NtrC family response regulator